MPDLTRDEHNARAESLAGRAYEIHQYLEDTPSSDADGRTIAEMHALAALAQAYGTLAGQSAAEAPAWEWTAGNSLVHSSGDWEMEYIHHCETGGTHAKAGWYLYGKALKQHGPRWVGASPRDAMALADRGIDALAARLPRTWSGNGTEYDLGRKYRSSRGDFTFEFVGTLTDGMPLVREYPAGVRALINPFATVLRMFGPLVPVDEDEVPF